MPTTHVTSLELSIRLKELGVPQKSLFSWYFIDAPTTYAGPELGYHGIDFPNETSEVISAYLASEIEKLMPKGVNMPYKNGKPRDDNHYLLFGRSGNNNYSARYVNNRYDSDSYIDGRDAELANAFAKTLIEILERGLISVEELGK